ncbi:MAG: type II secretion system protein GspN [Proteobacteria bacterium]|nr:MAG: type II secretion system protein GspN [Pseudomonadota bacterium]
MATAQPELAPPFGLTGARRALAIALAASVLTAFFVVIGFPYHLVTARIERAVEAATGARVEIGRFAIGLHWLLPQLRAWDVDVTTPAGRRLQLARVRVHPAPSLAWLRGRPALALALRSPLGELDGTVVVRGEPAFRGELRALQLGPLALLESIAPGAALDGRADAEIDLALAESGPAGSARFDVANGSLALPLLPIGVPFESLHGDLVLGGDALAKIEALDLAGPLIAFQAKGVVGAAPVAVDAPLDLDATLEVRDPTVRSMIGGQGIALDASGRAELHVGGTLGNPRPESGRRGARPR